MDERSFTLNMETQKLELRFPYEEFQNLSVEQKKAIKSTYLWGRKTGAWISRAKYPNTYRAEIVAKQLGFDHYDRSGERRTFEEQLEQKQKRAEHRVERYEKYAANAAQRADTLAKGFESHRGDWAYATQPGHIPSRERELRNLEKSTGERNKSNYFLGRAQTAQKTADQRQLENPGFLSRRIVESTAAIRKMERERRNPELLEAERDKLQFYENKLRKIGGMKYHKKDIKVGYLIHVGGKVRKVTKVNPASVDTVLPETAIKRNFRYEEILEIVARTEEPMKTIPHPYQVGNILVMYNFAHTCPLKAYQVTAVTEKTVQIQQLCLNQQRQPLPNTFVDGSKPLRRIPRILQYSDKWIIGVDDRRLYLWQPTKKEENANE